MDYNPSSCEQYVRWHASTYELRIIPRLSGQVDLAKNRDPHAVSIDRYPDGRFG